MTCLTQSLRPLGLARLDQRLASLTQARCLQFQLSECTLHLSMRKAFSGPTPKRGSFDTNSPKGAKSLARGHPVVQGDTCSLLRSGRRVMLIEQRKVSQDPDHTGRTRQSWDVGSCSPAQNLGPPLPECRTCPLWVLLLPDLNFPSPQAHLREAVTAVPGARARPHEPGTLASQRSFLKLLPSDHGHEPDPSPHSALNVQ